LLLTALLRFKSRNVGKNTRWLRGIGDGQRALIQWMSCGVDSNVISDRSLLFPLRLGLRSRWRSAAAITADGGYWRQGKERLRWVAVLPLLSIGQSL